VWNGLLSLGAAVDSRLRNRGSSPLHLAVQPTGAGGTAGAIDEQLLIIASLIRFGADPRLPTTVAGRLRDCARSAASLRLWRDGSSRQSSPPVVFWSISPFILFKHPMAQFPGESILLHEESTGFYV